MLSRAISRAIVISIFIIFLLSNCDKKDPNGYKGDLIPLESEIGKIENYERSTNMIIESFEKYGSRASIPYNIQKGLTVFQKDSLNLRFLSEIGGFDISIEGNDTLIKFKADRGDYHMRSNSDWNTYTLFRHSIFYTNKPIPVGEFTYSGEDQKTMTYAVFKIKNRFYYSIDSEIEY